MYAQSTNNETCTRKHYCFFVLRHVGKARLDTLVTLDTFVSTSSTRSSRLARLARQSRTCRVVSSRDEPSGIWAYWRKAQKRIIMFNH